MKSKSKFVIGDIQGCYKEFKSLLKLIDPNKENKFFCVGDLVNRGPESEKVIEYVLENKIKSVCSFQKKNKKCAKLTILNEKFNKIPFFRSKNDQQSS